MLQLVLSREQILNLALLLGKVLLISGAETYRVEDTILRFCSSNGLQNISVFATPTLIIIGDETSSTESRVSRIRVRNTSLDKISAINDFSYNLRKWENTDYHQIKAFLQEIADRPPIYGKWAICFSSALCSAAFSAMLGGNQYDFLAAFATGGLSMLLVKQIAGMRPSVFWENAVAGAAIGLLAVISCELCHECTRMNIVVGALMPFVPGVAFTNSLRDYIAGDLISGNSRLAEALLLATALAIGLGFSLLFWYNQFGWRV